MSFTSFRLSVLLRLPQLIVCASMVPQNGFEWRRWVVLCKHATAFLLPLKRGIQPWCSAEHFFSSAVINKASKWSWLSFYLSFPDIFSARGITGLKSLLNFQYSRVRCYFLSPSLFFYFRGAAGLDAGGAVVQFSIFFFDDAFVFSAPAFPTPTFVSRDNPVSDIELYI